MLNMNEIEQDGDGANLFGLGCGLSGIVLCSDFLCTTFGLGEFDWKIYLKPFQLDSY
jgi:hypothetical protein